MISNLRSVQILAIISNRIASGTKPTAGILSVLTGVGERQVHRYIKTLRKLGAPIPVSHATHGYEFKSRWSFERALIRWLKDSTV